jgi:hypothetical protein
MVRQVSFPPRRACPYFLSPAYTAHDILPATVSIREDEEPMCPVSLVMLIHLFLLRICEMQWQCLLEEASVMMPTKDQVSFV